MPKFTLGQHGGVSWALDLDAVFKIRAVCTRLQLLQDKVLGHGPEVFLAPLALLWKSILAGGATSE